MDGAPLDARMPIDLATLPAHLDRIAMPRGSSETTDARIRKEFHGELANLARRVMQADYVQCRRHVESPLDGGVHDGPPQDNEAQCTVTSGQCDRAVLDQVDCLSQLASRSGKTEIDQFEGRCLIATVADPLADARSVLVTVLDIGQASVEPFVITQQLVTSSIPLWQARTDAAVSYGQAQRQQWIAELRRSIDRCTVFSQVASNVVDAVAIGCSAYQVALCLCNGDDVSQIKIAAVGGSGTPIADSIWKAAASETLIRRSATQWPARASNEKVATIAHQKLAAAGPEGSQVSSLPLWDERGQPFAVLVMVTTDPSRAVMNIDSVSTDLADLIRTWQQTHRPLSDRVCRSVSAFLENRRKFIALTVAVALIALIPVPYRVTARATIVPHTRSFVVAPHDGLLRRTNVRVGDVVKRGAPIAELDDRELRLDMAALTAERNRAAKQRDIQRASGTVADEQLAEFELARVEEQIRLTRHRLDNLVVTAAIDGIVIDGQFEDVSGAPVATGDPLAEIAMLDRLWVEVGVPEDDVTEIRVGQQVRVGLSADGSILEGTIDSMSPGAQVRGDENVFVARVLVKNPGGFLRPGISGTAKISADRRPMVGVLLREVWRQIKRFWI